MVHPLAGKPAPQDLLVNVPRLVSAYYLDVPDPSNPAERVKFGTSGHRGSALQTCFNLDHIIAICRAVVDYRIKATIDGPLFLAKDTHALSEPSFVTALEVFAAAGVDVFIDERLGYTPTPVVSHAIRAANARLGRACADGVVLTPSHNPPEDGGLKYNPPSGGPAGSTVTRWIEARANALLEEGVGGVRRIPYKQALKASTTHRFDYMTPYIDDLEAALDMEAIAGEKVSIGVDPLGGAGIAYWEPIAERYGLDLTVVNHRIDPAFSFMPLDHDGKIRMDCSSPYAMASLIAMRDRFDVAFGNDPDFDRHGIVTPSGGLLNPNHFLSVAVDYLYRNRPWREDMAVGKTLVSSSMLDRVAASLGREVYEVPVGFKWFVEPLVSGRIAFGGEESAGATFLRIDGGVWTTDKDGILLALLAAEITAITGADPHAYYTKLEAAHGAPRYARVERPATDAQKAAFASLTPERARPDELAGDPVTVCLTHAPGNGASIGGLKIATDNGWFAARPSGTEAVYKIYAESFLGESHLLQIQEEAASIVTDALAQGAE